MSNFIVRKCASCNDEFETKIRFGRQYSYCRKCQSTQRKKQWQLNKEKISKINRESFLKNKYKISIEEYNFLYLKQFGECAICRRKNGSIKRKIRLAVDHDHKTGKVRGLLCQPCNTAIGMLQDDIKIIKRLLAYMKGMQ